jgi:hypothetical protein
MADRRGERIIANLALQNANCKMKEVEKFYNFREKFEI